MAELLLVIVYLAFLVVVIVLAKDDHDLARSVANGLVETIAKVFSTFK